MWSESLITLYDAASHPGKPLAWNPMVLKARYSLTFKGVPHKTIWLEYPDVEPTMRRIGASPTSTKPDGSPFYTLPVIVDPSRRTSDGGPIIVSDSWEIAKYLDIAYPSPAPLIPKETKAMQRLFTNYVDKTLYFNALAPILVFPTVTFLNEPSRTYWHETREARYGEKLEGLCPKGSPKWDVAWGKVQKALDEIAELLDRNGNEGSTLVMGSKVTFADIGIVSFLDTIFMISPEEWEKQVKVWNSGRWERFRDQFAAWRTVH